MPTYCTGCRENLETERLKTCEQFSATYCHNLRLHKKYLPRFINFWSIWPIYKSFKLVPGAWTSMGETSFRKKAIGTAQKNELEALLRVEVKQNFRGVLSVSLKVMERTTRRVGFWGWSWVRSWDSENRLYFWHFSAMNICRVSVLVSSMFLQFIVPPDRMSGVVLG
jgi:hypothetical protein